jgi:hypothetical protein
MKKGHHAKAQMTEDEVRLQVTSCHLKNAVNGILCAFA